MPVKEIDGEVWIRQIDHEKLVEVTREESFQAGKKSFLKDISKISHSHKGKQVAYIIQDEAGKIDWEKLKTLTKDTPAED